MAALVLLGFPVSESDFWEVTSELDSTCFKGHPVINLGARYCTECGVRILHTKVSKPKPCLHALANGEMEEDFWDTLIDGEADDLFLENLDEKTYILGIKLMHTPLQKSCQLQDFTDLLTKVQEIRKRIDLEFREIALYTFELGL